MSAARWSDAVCIACGRLTARRAPSAAFALYHATLLPGLDFGDTGSFQTTVGVGRSSRRATATRSTSPSAMPFLWLTRRGPGARAESRVGRRRRGRVRRDRPGRRGAVADRSLAGGGVPRCSFAGSYTFWSQAIIAEVYALHILFVALTLLLLLRWERAPDDRGGSALFFARVRARLRQSPVDDSARARLHDLPAHGRAGRLAIDVARRGSSRSPLVLRRRRRAAVRLEPARAVARARTRRTASSTRCSASGSTSRRRTGATRW